MIVIPKLKLLFTHVPKTGGSAVTAALLPYLDKELVYPIDHRGWQPHFHDIGNMHAVWESIEGQARPYLDQGYRYFAVHRSPFERFSSLYHKRAVIGGKGDYKDISIEDFVTDETGRFRWHMISCLQIAGPMVTDWIDYLHLEEELHALLISAGVKNPAPMIRANVTENKLPSSEVLTPAAISIIESRFQDDIQRFGYLPPKLL